MNDNAEFNIINLNAETGHFGKALERWRKYQINDFTTPNVNLRKLREKQ